MPKEGWHEQERAPDDGREPAGNRSRQKPAESGRDQDDAGSGADTRSLGSKNLEQNQRRCRGDGEEEDVIELHRWR